jgi:hypothetical protein
MSTLKLNVITSKSASNDLELQINDVTKWTLDKTTGHLKAISGVGFDFSADSKGVFKGLESIVYRMTNDSSTSTENPLGPGSDWEIADDTENENHLGASSSVTESSGIFSFGSTGYWQIHFQGTVYSTSGANYLDLALHATDDNSTYSNLAGATATMGGTNYYGTVQNFANIKVTSTSNDKVKLIQTPAGTQKLLGSTNANFTCISFTKLADL